MTDRFPVDRFSIKKSYWSLAGQRLSGGQSVSGLTQVARADGGGYWTADLKFLVLGINEIRLWRAYSARLSAADETIIVPHRGVWIKVQLGSGVTFVPVSHSDGATFSDGSQYIVSPVVGAVFGGAAALRATQVQLNFTTEVDILSGEFFTVVHANAGERMYQIKSIVSQSGNNYTVKISPPLREAVTTSTELDFDDPRCLMRVVDGVDQDVGVEGISEPNPVFVEHFDPLPAS